MGEGVAILRNKQGTIILIVEINDELRFQKRIKSTETLIMLKDMIDRVLMQKGETYDC